MKFFKLASNAYSYPKRATKDSVGYDVVALDSGVEEGYYLVYDTGIKVGELPPNTHIKVYPRSSIRKMDLRLSNSVGIIDGDYPDTIKICFDFRTEVSFGDLKRYKKGDKIAQLVIESHYIENTEMVPEKIRVGGFGSTGMKIDVPEPKPKKSKRRVRK